MKKSWMKNSGMVAVAMAGLLAATFADAKVTPGKCTPPPKVQNVDCGKEDINDKAMQDKCKACNGKLTESFGGSKFEKAGLSYNACTTLPCSSASDTGSPDAALGSHVGGKGTMSSGGACLAQKAGFNKDTADAGADCLNALKSCDGLKANAQIVKDDKNACKTAKTDGTDTAKDQADKGKAADDNAKKNDDNAKKDGGMPQMPQIPQMPQQQSDSPQQPPQQDAATSPTPTDTGNSTSSQPSTEVSKIGDGTTGSGSSSPGASGPTLPPSTVAAPGFPGFPGAAPAPGSNGNGTKLGENGNGAAPAVASVGGGGGASAPSGALNTSGASVPGGGDKSGAAGDKGAGDANPYEMNLSGGGKLGAPKGFKGGSDPDAVIADGAKNEFKADFGKDDKGRDVAGGTQNPEDDPDNGYTIFKMVKYRYVELKKAGTI